MPSRRHVLALLAGSVAGCSKPVLSVPAIEDQPCPPVEAYGRRAVCSHTEQGDDGLQITVSPDTVSTDQKSLKIASVRIDNETDEPGEYHPYRWQIYRNAGWGWEKWKDLSAPESEANANTIEPGGSAGWHGLDALWKIGATGPTPAGLYAAVNTVFVNEEAVACVALFRVVEE